MKKLLSILLFVFIISLSLVFNPKISANTNDFVINSFNAKYLLSREPTSQTSKLEITETIEITFPSTDQNHGIERAIPATYKNRSIDVTIKDISDKQGNPIKYKTAVKNDNLVIRIGDNDKYIHGQQTYVINYTVKNVITFYDDHDEWYWDVNGDEWNQTMQSVSATITLDDSIANNLLPDKKCFTGSYGSKESACHINSDGNIISIYSNRSLNPKENLSFVLGFKPKTFNPISTNWNKIIFIGSVIILPPIITFILMFRRWLKSGRDPKGKGLVVPEYLPPKKSNVLISDVVLNEKLRTLAISASIIELCILGYLKISEIEKD